MVRVGKAGPVSAPDDVPDKEKSIGSIPKVDFTFGPDTLASLSLSSGPTRVDPDFDGRRIAIASFADC